MNFGFILRASVLAIPSAVIISSVTLAVSSVRLVMGPPPDPTPPPPTISVPRGEIPSGNVAFQEWVQYRDEGYSMVGCGFLLALNDGHVFGVTTAHSARPGDPRRPLERIRLHAQPSGYTVDFDAVYIPIGRPRDSDDLTVDYLLLHSDPDIDPAYVLWPDPRGAPLPGERVLLYKCLGGNGGGQHILGGTVQSVDGKAVWVLMDLPFSLAQWSGSGSPLVSEHTGQVVGMLVAGTLRERWMLLGMHPVRSLVQKAAAATVSVRLVDYMPE